MRGRRWKKRQRARRISRRGLADVEGVARDIRKRARFVYAPSNTGDGSRLRQIKVSAKAPGNISSRYYAPDQAFRRQKRCLRNDGIILSYSHGLENRRRDSEFLGLHIGSMVFLAL